jgi:hypothetical protein
MSRPQFAVTLEPLRSQGPDALDAREFPEIHHIKLRGIKFARPNALHETITRQADDLFRCAELEPEGEGVLPAGAIPTQAFFDVHFRDAAPPRSVLLRAPATGI